jgi:excisionase family DNA binding protein
VGDLKPLRDGQATDALLMTPEEAANVLRVGRTTIYALIKAGELRPVHIGRSCRLSRAELQRYVCRLEAPQPIPPRSPARRRSRANQRGLFDVDRTPPDAA